MALTKDAITKKKPATIQTEQETPRTAAAEMAAEEAESARRKKNEQTRRAKNAREGLRQIAVYVDSEVYEDLQRLSKYRAGRDGQTNIQITINKALRAYRDACKEELAAWDSAAIPEND